MDARAQEFRRLVRRENRGRTRRGYRYSEALQREAISYSQARLAAGETLEGVAEKLGLSSWTLVRWRKSGGGGLRRVQVVECEPGPEPSAGSLVLVTPGGYRIEGLGLGEVESLLERLR